METIKFIAAIGSITSQPLSQGGGIRLVLELPESYSVEMAKLHTIKAHTMVLKVNAVPVEWDKSMPEKQHIQTKKKSSFYVKQRITKVKKKAPKKTEAPPKGIIAGLFNR
jgi:hypothetical protein